MIINVNQSPDAHYTVYRFTLPNGKIYIGCTGLPVKKRWSCSYAQNLEKEIAFYGTENITREVLCEKLLREAAYDLEKKLIELYDSCDPEIGYNLVSGGEVHGRQYSPALIENMVNRSFVDPEYTKIISAARKKAANDPVVKKKKGDIIRKFYSDESHKEHLKRPKPPIRVRCVTTGIIYSSMREAAKANNISVASISRACREKGRYCNGLLWEHA